MPGLRGWARRWRPMSPPGPVVRGRLIAALLVIGVSAGAVAGLSALRVDTQPTAFLPAGDPTLQELEEVASSFGGDPIVVLAESAEPRQLLGPGQLPGLLRLEGALAGLPDVAAVYGPATVLNQLAITSQNLLAEMSGRRDAARTAAEQRTRNAGAGAQAVTAAGDAAVAEFDQRYVPLLVRGMPAGLPTLHNPGFVDNVVFEESGLPRAQWQFVVPAPNAVSILVRPREGLSQQATDRLVDAVDQAVRDAGLQTERVTVTGAPAVAAALADQVRREIPLLGGLAVVLIAACYFLVPWLGSRRNRLLPMAATLAGTALTLAVFGWLGRPLSLGAMAFLPILIGIGSDFPAYLVQRGARRRVLVAALASAAGFASLAISPLPFVRDLGLALAMGVVLAVAVAVAFRHHLVRAEPEQPDEPSRPRFAPSRAARVGLATVAVLVAGTGWVCLPWLDLRASPDELAAGLPAMAGVEHAERVLGSSGEVRLVLNGPNVLTPEALDWMRAAQNAVVVEHGSRLRPIVGLPDLLAFLGPSPTEQQILAAARLLPSYLVGTVATPDGKAATISFGIELQDLSDQQRLIDAVRAALPPPPPGFEADVAGLPVVAARGYELVSGDRYLANSAGIVAAGLVLLIGLRRRSDAVRAVAAAVLATGWGLGVLAALGLSLSPLTVALGSLTTATACEFTVLLAGERRRRQRRTVAVAALAAAVGYATLLASGLVVIRDFGLLLSATVLLSLAAAHLVLLIIPRRPDSMPAPAIDEPRPRTVVTV